MMNREKNKVNTKRRGNTNSVFVILGFLICLVIVSISGSIMSGACSNKESEQEAYLYYQNVELTSEDTLWDLAETYMNTSTAKETRDAVEVIKSVNALSNDTIYAGDQLVIPLSTNDNTDIISIASAQGQYY